MAIKTVLNNSNVQKFENNYLYPDKIITLKKVFKIASIFFSFSAALCFCSIFIVNISSALLMGGAIASAICAIPFAISSYFFSNKLNYMTPQKLIKSLDEYNSKFEELDPEIYLGKFEKIDLEKKSQIILKADLHGDFFSLIQHLKTLQKKGVLDENLKITKEFQGKTVLAFLGDYIDRGENSFEILDLLIKLKINNPNEVALIRGNHEYLNLSKIYINDKEKHFYKNEELCNKLERFFFTLPLCVFVGTKDDNNKYQYACLTHGAIDPDVDVNELLENPSKKATIFIEKNKTARLSKRILDILPKHLRHVSLKDIQTTVQALEDFISNPSFINQLNLIRLLKTTNIDKKKAKQILSILKVQNFIIKHYAYIEMERKNNNTSFNWGDISSYYLGINIPRGAGLLLTPEFIKDYFRAVSSEYRKIKVLRAGHAHKHDIFPIKDKQGFIEILPAAGEIENFDRLRPPVDHSEILTIDPKIKDWKKQVLLRERKNLGTKFLPKQDFYHSIYPLNTLG